MLIGSGWTKKDDNGQVTGISIRPDDALCEMFPQLKGLRFTLKPVPKDQRQNEKAPGWRLITFKPEEQTQAASGGAAPTDEEIPF